MRAGSIYYHYDEVTRVTLTNLLEEFTHAWSIHLRTDLPIKVSFARADGSVGVDKLSLVSIEHDRSTRLWRPASSGFRHPAKPRLILKHESNPPASHHVSSEQGRQSFREFFFQAFMIVGTFFGCFVSGATFRHPCRDNNRQTTEAFTGWPTRCAKAARIGERTNRPASRAWSAQGFRKSTSSWAVSSDFRLPPQFLIREEEVRPVWKRICNLLTEAVPTPSMLAVSSRVRPTLAGSKTASAERKSSKSRVVFTVRFALATSFTSMRIDRK